MSSLQANNGNWLNMNLFVEIIKKIILELFIKLGYLYERQSLNLSDFARAA